MLSKCANPSCDTPFHYLREGRLFQIEKGVETDGAAQVASPQGLFIAAGRKPSQRVEHFWLCGPCSRKLTLAVDRAGTVATVPLTGLSRHAAAS